MKIEVCTRMNSEMEVGDTLKVSEDGQYVIVVRGIAQAPGLSALVTMGKRTVENTYEWCASVPSEVATAMGLKKVHAGPRARA